MDTLRYPTLDPDFDPRGGAGEAPAASPARFSCPATLPAGLPAAASDAAPAALSARPRAKRTGASEPKPAARSAPPAAHSASPAAFPVEPPAVLFDDTDFAPARAGEAAPAPRVARSAAAASFGSVLVVDDSTVQRDHTVRLCRELGLEHIYEARDGHEALELLALLMMPPGLIIIDLEMPGMDGIELMEGLHQTQVAVPLIVASTREASLLNSVEQMGRALDLRMLGVLQKPLTHAALDALMSREQRQRGPAGARQSRPPPTRAALEQAIAGGEIVPHFQPKVDMRTGLLRGVEALARWQRPDGGRVGPDQFIPVAESEELIHPLTMTILDQSLAQLARWNKRGFKLSLAVNLSARLLESPRLVQEIETLTRAHAVPPAQVVLEITESSVVTYLGTALAVIGRLRLKGFGLSIDDYGTGYSSLQQLVRIPFTELKIDRSFVHEATRNRNLRVILRSALDLARHLDLITVAEGIEHLEDWRLLQEYGCDIGQGFLIGKPMPGDELVPWLKAHTAQRASLRAREDRAGNGFTL